MFSVVDTKVFSLQLGMSDAVFKSCDVEKMFSKKISRKNLFRTTGFILVTIVTIVIQVIYVI